MKSYLMGACAVALILIGAALESGCASSRPALSQVDSGAEQKPINSPEMAAELRRKHGQ